MREQKMNGVEVDKLDVYFDEINFLFQEMKDDMERVFKNHNLSANARCRARSMTIRKMLKTFRKMSTAVEVVE